MASDQMIVRISEKPVTSKISLTAALTFLMHIDPCLFIIFCAARRTRRPADEMYSRF